MQQLTLNNLKENSESVEVRVNEQWYQEDIKDIYANLSTRLGETKLLEQILGADKESFRLQWQSYELTVNFEVYSQSIWFEKMPTGAQEVRSWKSELIQRMMPDFN